MAERAHQPVAPTRRWIGPAWDALRSLYATADPRSLGLLRILLGLLLVVDVGRRLPDLNTFYTNDGVLTNHFALYRPMSSHLFSLYLACSSSAEVHALWAAHVGVALSFTVGYRTRLMHVLLALLTVSISSRNIMLENGGWVVLTELVVWSMFLPLGRRFSVDAWLASWRERREASVRTLNDRSHSGPSREAIVSLAVTAMLLQFAIIYYFNVIHKTGPTWHRRFDEIPLGTALHFFFQQDRMLTTFGAWLRPHLTQEALWVASYSALVFESAICGLLVVPYRSPEARMLAFALAVMLHFGIDVCVQLGPFSYSMMVVHVAFIAPLWWDSLGVRLGARLEPRSLRLRDGDSRALLIARIVKRLDHWHRVTFESVGADAATACAVGAGERVLTGREAIASLMQALPLPSVLGKLVRLVPLVGARIDEAFDGSDDVRGVASYFGFKRWGDDELAIPDSELALRARALRARVAQFGVAMLIVATGSQVLMENPAIPAALKPARRPAWMDAVVVYPRLFQGWSMFAPDVPLHDGVAVVDGRTADGRRLDPFTGEAPLDEPVGPNGLRLNQLFGEYHRRIGEDRFKAYLPGLRDHLVRRHEHYGSAEDRLVAFDVYYVGRRLPRPGEPSPEPYRKLLISWKQ